MIRILSTTLFLYFFLQIGSGIAQNNLLDPTFGTGGIVITDLKLNPEYIAGAAIDGEQRIVTITNLEFNNEKTYISRYQPDGTLDSSFNATGVITFEIYSDYGTYSTGVATDTANRVYVLLEANEYYSNQVLLLRFKSDGAPDPTFSFDGSVLTALDESSTLLLQPDSKILVAGSIDDNLAMQRFNSNGSIDATFGSNGKTVLNIGNFDCVYDLALQPDGKIVFTGSRGSGSGWNKDVVTGRLLADGTVDNTFGDNGYTTINIASNVDIGKSVAIHADGSIWVVGSISDPYVPDAGAFLIHYDSEGVPDTAFDVNGVRMISPGMYGNTLDDIVVQPDGKLLLSGASWLSSGKYAFVLRLTNTGDNDASFGSDGIYIGDQTLYPGQHLIIQPDEKIILAGNRYHTGDVDMWMERVEPDGIPDPGFSLDEKVADLFEEISSDAGREIAVQPDGKVLVAATSFNWAYYSQPAILRYNQDGTLDNNFGTNGVYVPNDFANALSADIMLHPDGTIDCGSDIYYDQGSFSLNRIQPDGTADTAFGFLGNVSPEFGVPGSVSATDFLLLPDGEILVSGTYEKTVNSPTGSDVFVMRMTSDGIIDSSFGVDGVEGTDVGANIFDAAGPLALQPDGKIIHAAIGWEQSGVFTDIKLLRYHPDGSLDTGFGVNGIATGNSLNDFEDVSSVIIQPDGKILLGGTERFYNNSLLMIIRFLPDGTLDTSFGVDGYVKKAIAPFWNYGRGLALQPDGKIIMAGHVNEGASEGWYDFAIVRYEPDGTPDLTFGNSGVVILDITDQDFSNSMILQPDGKIVVTGASESDIVVFRLDPSIATAADDFFPVDETVVKLYPNPVLTSATLSIESRESRTAIVEVKSLLGESILREEIFLSEPKTEVMFDLSNLTVGPYIITVQTGTNLFSRKLIKS